MKLNQISMRAETSMEAIAETTGGTAFVPESDKDLERVFRQVAAELRGQYLLQYYGNSEAAPGQFHGHSAPLAGQWDLVIELSRDGARMFRSRNRVFLH